MGFQVAIGNHFIKKVAINSLPLVAISDNLFLTYIKQGQKDMHPKLNICLIFVALVIFKYQSEPKSDNAAGAVVRSLDCSQASVLETMAKQVKM